MRAKILMAGLVCVLAAPVVYAQTAATPQAKQWQITTTTAITGSPPLTTSNSVCVGPDDLRNPPPAITGPVCDRQTYNLEDNNLKWTGTCDQAKGKGNIVFADDGQSFSGDVDSTVRGAAVTTHVDGKVIGTCRKS